MMNQDESPPSGPYTPLRIAVYPAVNLHEVDEDDREVPGLYSVMVDASLSPEDMASAVLDLFAVEIPVAATEDFRFVVYDPETGLVLNESAQHVSYTKDQFARSLEYVGADMSPEVFAVTVLKTQGPWEEPVGEVVVAAADESAASTFAYRMLWEDALDAAGFVPRHDVAHLPFASSAAEESGGQQPDAAEFKLQDLDDAFGRITQGIWSQDGHCVTAPNPDRSSRDQFDTACLADCSDDPLSEEQSTANARFIALAHHFAPALLEAARLLKESKRWHEQERVAMEEDGRAPTREYSEFLTRVDLTLGRLS